MSSPLPPVLANIFMGFHQSDGLNEYNLKKPKFYLRYVDDILAAFGNEILRVLHHFHIRLV